MQGPDRQRQPSRGLQEGPKEEAMRDRIEGAWHWALLFLRGSRCFVCGKRYLAHWPLWRIFECTNRPLSVVIVEGRREAVA